MYGVYGMVEVVVAEVYEGARLSLYGVYGMVEVCEGAAVAVGGWFLADRHDFAPCAANSLHRVTIPVNNCGGLYATIEPKQK